jgi:hypothetical protein
MLQVAILLFCLATLFMLLNQPRLELAFQESGAGFGSVIGSFFKDAGLYAKTAVLNICVDLSSIAEDDCGGNSGGQVELYVARSRDIESIPDVEDEGGVVVEDNIVMKAGKNFVKWDFTMDTGELTHKATGDQGSQAIEWGCEVILAKGRPDVDEQVNAALNGKFVIIVKDGNGFTRIGGSLLRPMKFEHDYKSGKKFNDKNEYIMKFMGGGSHVPYTYTGVIPTATANVRQLGVAPSGGISYLGNYTWQMTEGTAETFTLSDVSGFGIAITSFTVTSGVVPTGMTAAINAGNIEIDGTTTTPGVYVFTVNATFADGQTKSVTMTVVVLAD